MIVIVMIKVKRKKVITEIARLLVLDLIGHV